MTDNAYREYTTTISDIYNGCHTRDGLTCYGGFLVRCADDALDAVGEHGDASAFASAYTAEVAADPDRR